MPAPLWFVLVALLAVVLVTALLTGTMWLAWAAGCLLALVLALIGWAFWVAWADTREGG